ncbi:unnamed protein product [Agarophyton chilense]
MSRKRPLQQADTPNTKRYLNGALAAELRELRISRTPTAAQSSCKNAFGVSFPPSAFYSNNFNPNNGVPSFVQSPSGVKFGSDFAGSLPIAPIPVQQQNSLGQNPIVTNPDSSDSSSSSVVMEDDDTDPRSFAEVATDNSMEDLIVEECDSEPSAENRLVIYRPPVRTNRNIVSRVNAVLPDGNYAIRNPKTDDWMIVARNRSEGVKRKLALVPWTGDPHKKLCDSLREPSRVIRMPWHDSTTEVTIVEVPNDVSANQEEAMEIEEIS